MRTKILTSPSLAAKHSRVGRSIANRSAVLEVGPASSDRSHHWVMARPVKRDLWRSKLSSSSNVDTHASHVPCFVLSKEILTLEFPNGLWPLTEPQTGINIFFTPKTKTYLKWLGYILCISNSLPCGHHVNHKDLLILPDVHLLKHPLQNFLCSNDSSLLGLGGFGLTQTMMIMIWGKHFLKMEPNLIEPHGPYLME